MGFGFWVWALVLGFLVSGFLVFEFGFWVLCIGYGFRVIGFVGYWVLGVGVLVFQVLEFLGF